ncbi:GIN domain-containing protein [Massilia sp. TS11]|uniref:GIN domain-containing protein n=1 Tax=Massilia sp. TS11 TaxID=2908003 RepID=UPI001EDA4E1C|nr:DUF2807 domain-containing protein [Massilia sp. TS11]MCG2586682.1 DUF2807 domain-containing protein [Massilia sp. TS11]
MRTSLTVLACALALGGCAIIVTPDSGDFRVHTAWSGEAGNGNVQTEQRAIGAIQSVEISGPMRVDLQVGQSPALALSADSNLLPMIRTEMRGETLRIWVDGNISSSRELAVQLALPQLQRLALNGSGKVVVRDLNNTPFSLEKNGSGSTQLTGQVQRFEVRVNGSGSVNATALSSGTTRASLNGSARLELGSVRGDALNLSINGSGNASVQGGTVQSVNAVTYGSGGANLTALTALQGDLSTHGSGDIYATVRENVIANSHGSGRVTVYGNPPQRTVSGRHVNVL